MAVMSPQAQKEKGGMFGSTMCAKTTEARDEKYVEDGGHSTCNIQKTIPANTSTSDSGVYHQISEQPSCNYWNPEYADGEMDEFLAFCLEGFLFDWTWPEEEIRFNFERTSKAKKKKSAKRSEKRIEESDGDGKKKQHSRKEKTAKKWKNETSESKNSVDAETANQKTNHPIKKKTNRKDGLNKGTRRKFKQNELIVNSTSETICQTSSHTASSSDTNVSFFNDGSSDGRSVQDDHQATEEMDEAAKIVQLRLDMAQAAADAASLGRLTRLSEKVIESTSLEPVEEPVDTWKRKNVAETELNRSNHFKVINEAAAVGQMKRVRNKTNTRNTALQGWDEHEEAKNEEVPLDWRHCSSSNFTRPERSLRQTRPKKLLLSSHERMDRFVEDEVAEKKKSMYAPDQLLERQQQKDEALSRFLSGDMDWLPSTNLPTIALPKVFLSKKRIRASLVTEVAEACAARNRRLSCNFRLQIRKSCTCPYCKSPSAIQTLAYQVLQGKCSKEEQEKGSASPKRFNSAPRVLTCKTQTTAAVNPAILYSRTTLRRAKTDPPGFESFQTPRHIPSWAAATLKKAEVGKMTKEDSSGEAPPIWALVTGTRDDNLPEWASPALRELLTQQPIPRNINQQPPEGNEGSTDDVNSILHNNNPSAETQS
ncbi:hypothetical protein IV203_032684 [Nitzschia inconspicua]|uniref:Uncharacterized protein n=1 Tax=Nitzschia inconspicua TaxID=303405 RepID=A0A9K3KLU6_9STRA|nr:hypothetical protein IV203_032684 [Nitzschia inconspicua]